jgi:hypothetical protein
MEETDQDLLGGGLPGAARLTEMRDFYAFLLDEIPALLDRWAASRSPI